MRNHIIRSLKLDISFYSEQQAPVLYTRISNLANNKIYSVINKVFDEELNDSSIFICMDKLELDIGQLSYSELDNLLPERIYSLLKKALQQQLALAGSFSGQSLWDTGRDDEHTVPALQKTESKHNQDLLSAFLKTGILPWWATDVTGEQLESMFLDWLAKAPSEVVAWIYSGNNSSNVIQRLVYQFSETALSALAEATARLSPSARTMLQNSALIKEALKASPYTIHFKKERWWKVLLDICGANYTSSQPDHAPAVHFIFEYMALDNTADAKNLVAAAADYFEHKNMLPDAEQTLLQTIKQLQVSLDGGDLKQLKKPAKQPQPVAMSLLELIRKMGQKQAPEMRLFMMELSWLKMKNPKLYEKTYSFAVKHAMSLEKHSDFGRYAYEVFDFTRTELSVDRSVIGRLDAAFPKPGPRKVTNEEYIAAADEVHEAEVCHIANAGLVILNPFLPVYYNRMGLMKDGQFISKNDAAKAVHLLQFLVDGRQEHDEHLLMLNKLLCGVDVSEPIERNVPISENDEKISMELLNAVKDNWDRMKQSSVAALRAEFLQRQGQLKHYHNKWVLRVEHNGRSDYLLEKIPWSFSMIKNSWMPEILNVEWI